jgi:hypothetical protein
MRALFDFKLLLTFIIYCCGPTVGFQVLYYIFFERSGKMEGKLNSVGFLHPPQNWNMRSPGGRRMMRWLVPRCLAPLSCTWLPGVCARGRNDVSQSEGWGQSKAFRKCFNHNNITSCQVLTTASLSPSLLHFFSSVSLYIHFILFFSACIIYVLFLCIHTASCFIPTFI